MKETEAVSETLGTNFCHIDTAGGWEDFILYVAVRASKHAEWTSRYCNPLLLRILQNKLQRKFPIKRDIIQRVRKEILRAF
jgi:hypothetical protein